MSSRDPFDDPFFRDGFGSSSSLFGHDPLMSSFFGGGGHGEGRGRRRNDPFSHIHSMMDNMHRDMMKMMAGHRSAFASLGSGDPLFDPPHHHLLDHDHRGESQGSQVEVEDVSDHPHHHHHHHHERSTSQPVVEEPDDDGDADLTPPASSHVPVSRSQRSQHRAQRERPQVFSYSSSTTTRIGPNGVAESRHIAQDSTGNKRMAVRRGVGQQAREWVQERAADGRERSREQLYGMSEDQVDQFDQRWEQERVRLPGERGGLSYRALGHQGRPASHADDHAYHDQARPLPYQHSSSGGGHYPASDQASVSSRASSRSQQHRY